MGTLKGHKDAVAAASFSHCGQSIVSSSHDNVIIIWNACEPFQQLAALSGHTYVTFKSVLFSRLTPSSTNRGTVFDCSFTPDDSKIVSCSFDRTVKMWEVDPAWLPSKEKTRPERRSNKPFTNMSGHSARILNTAYAPNGRLIATASRDKTLKVWYASALSPHFLSLPNETLKERAFWS